MLDYFPEKRISARELLRHPWLKMPNIYKGKLSDYDILRSSFDENYLNNRSGYYEYFYKNELNCDFIKYAYDRNDELNEDDDENNDIFEKDKDFDSYENDEEFDRHNKNQKSNKKNIFIYIFKYA